MKELPLALQSALQESERQFTQLLQRLGLTRQDLDGVAQRIRREHPKVNHRPQQLTNPGRCNHD